MIRKGAKTVQPRKKEIKLELNRTSYARAFMVQYIFRHSQSSPSDTILYVDHIGTRNMYQVYSKEIEKKDDRLGLSWFSNVWHQLLRDGVTDSETGTDYEVCVRRQCHALCVCEECYTHKP